GDTLPFASAGIDQSAGSGTTVTFDGSGSFDLEGPLNYTWTFVYDGQTVTRWGVNPQWVFLIDGVYPVTLTVRDSIGQTDSDVMTVTVTTIPEFPAIGIPLLVLAVGSIVLGFERRRRRQRS
ncbi:PKD domain-containing protein, partial [Candidatus Bathyarchaeota archaeon]|nr:PKD domain-containing protein [Candidatus Bathyarchaeota archaeon]